MSREQIARAFIPENFQSGVNLLGKTYKIINLVEGGVLGVGGFALFFLLLKATGLTIETTIGIAICVGAGLVFLGASGIDDEPLHEYVKNVILFYKNRRTAIYNKKPKKDAKHFELEGDDIKTELLPKEVLAQLYEQYKKKLTDSSRAKMLEQEQNSDGEEVEYIFDDDIEALEELNSKNKKKKGKKVDEKE